MLREFISLTNLQLMIHRTDFLFD